MWVVFIKHPQHHSFFPQYHLESEMPFPLALQPSFGSTNTLTLKSRNGVHYALSLTKIFSKLQLPIPPPSPHRHIELRLEVGGADSHMKMVGNYSSQCITKKLLFGDALKMR